MSTTISVGIALTLLNLRRVGRKTAWKLADRLADMPDSVAGLHAMLHDVAGAVPRFKAPSLEDLEEASRQATRIQDQAAACSVGVLGPGDLGFPRRLLGIPDPPLVLFFKGDLEVLNAARAVAVIGTRTPSVAGRKAASLISRRLVRRNIVVVSGLALGCDTEAHQAIVEEHGKGIAVLAHGLDAVSPASNRRLAESLVGGGGCLVSEYPCGERAQKQHFVDRDRIQSGLADAVVLIEAAEKSGSMHTVGFAHAQHRFVGAVSFSSEQPEATGNHLLLGRGEAAPITTPASLDRWLMHVLPGIGDPEQSDTGPYPNATPNAESPAF